MRNIGAEMESKYRMLFLLGIFMKKHTAGVFLGVLAVMPLLLAFFSNPFRIFDLYLKFLIISVSYLASCFAFCYILPKALKIRMALKLHTATIFFTANYFAFAFLYLIAIYAGYFLKALRISLEAIAVGFAGWECFLTLYVMTSDSAKGAALKGACTSATIILSDLLTPWDKIFISNPSILAVIALSVILTLSSITVLALKTAELFSEFDAVSGLRGFFFTVFTQDASMLERAFEETAIERIIPIGLAKVKRSDGEELLIVAPYIHPGPFRDVGSSNMPYEIYRAFSEDGIDAITLHGTCSHGENIPSRRKLMEFISKLKQEASSLTPGSTISKVVRIKRGNFTFTAQRFGEYVLLIVTRSPEDMDDISIAVGEKVSAIAEGIGIKSVLVDAHNSLSRPHAFPLLEDGTELAEEIVQGCKEALKMAIEADEAVGISWSRKVVDIPPHEGMGKLGVFVILIDEGVRKFAYIILDSNNLRSGMREKIINYLVEKGLIDDGEVLTTDTHYVNAYFPRTAYRLLDEEKLPILLPVIEEAVRECLDNLSDAKASGTVARIRVTVIGEEKITKLVAASSAMTRLYPVMLGLSLGILFLITSLLFLVASL